MSRTLPPDSVDAVAGRLAALGFRRRPDAPAEFTMDGRAVRLSATPGGVSSEVLVLGEFWVDAAVVSAAIDGTVLGGPPARTMAAAGEAALGAARLPAYQRSGRELDHLHQAAVYWWDAQTEGAPCEPGLLVLEVIHNYFDEELFQATWDSIVADRDALWEPELAPAQAAALAHALWLATGGELAREPVRFGQISLLPMLGDRCELRVIESTEHPKLVGEACLLDLDLVVTLHTTLRHLARLVKTINAQ